MIKNLNITTEALDFIKDSYNKKFGSLETFDENFNLRNYSDLC